VKTLLAAIFFTTAIVAQAPSVTYWCPMHPDVRSTAPGVCPRCGMTLVPMPPPSFDRYPVDFTLTPEAIVAGQPATLQIVVHGPHGDDAVTDFELVHEKSLHLFVVGQDLDYFAHIHPSLDAKTGAFTIALTLPAAGVYHLFADFLPTGGSPQVAHHVVVTAGFAGDLRPPAHLTPLPPVAVQDGMKIRLDTPQLVPGRRALVTCRITDAATGKPIGDLQPYLGARGHLLVLSDDLTQYVHSHPAADDPERLPSDVVFDVMFPQPGAYKLWAQFQRHDRVTTVAFTVDVKR
jgi:hypothetical protein